MTKPREPFTFASRIRSFGYAFSGLGFAFRTQHNFRIQILAAIIAVMLGALFKISMDDWRWIVLAIVMVLATELLNTAIEHLCDVVQPEIHPSVKAAKDVAAAAVLVMSIGAAVIGLMVFWPHVAALIWPAPP